MIIGGPPIAPPIGTPITCGCDGIKVTPGCGWMIWSARRGERERDRERRDWVIITGGGAGGACRPCERERERERDRWRRRLRLRLRLRLDRLDDRLSLITICGGTEGRTVGITVGGIPCDMGYIPGVPG
jgi:hypothetical protein